MQMGGSDGNSAVYQMQKYFGPLRNSDVEAWASDQFAHETHNLPKAYEGRNKFMMATIDFLITKDDDWYTRFALPWEYTEELHVMWNIWRFNKTMMDYEPHQGVPRYVTQESESHKDSLSRRGLAFIIEHGFWKTELGRSHYLMNLRQIVEAVHETCFFGVMMALLGADNYYNQWNKTHGTLHRTTLQTIVQDEKFLWAVCQKNIKGLFVMDAELKDRMRRKGIEPTGWIFPPKMAIYASMCPEYMTEYQRKGAPASTALEVGPRVFDTFRGLNVYETRTFDVDFQGEGIDPMTEHAQCGEYYVMQSSDFSRGIRIFDMKQDKFSHVALKEAVDNCQNPDILNGLLNRHHNAASFRKMWMDGVGSGTDAEKLERAQFELSRLLESYGVLLLSVFDVHVIDIPAVYAELVAADAFVDNPVDLALNPIIRAATKAREGAGAENHPNRRELFQAIATSRASGDVEGLASAMAKILLSEEWMGAVAEDQNPAADANTGRRSRDWNLEEFEKKGICLRPVKFLLMRPWQTYEMSHAILGRFGSELGTTFHGHHDFQLTDDIIHKVHIGHYTFYSKSIVRSPKHIYLAKNVYCQGYVHGEDMTFVPRVDGGKHLPGSDSRDVRSIISFAVPICDNLQNPLCALHAGFHTTMPTVDLDNTENGHFNLAGNDPYPPFLESHFEDTNYGGDTVHHNHVCWRGAVQHYNNKSGDFTDVEPSTGHWGPNVYDGCGDVRRGMYATFKE